MIFNDNDKEGKLFFKKYLENTYNNCKVILSDDVMARWDIICQLESGKIYYYELKVRPIESTRWNDSIIEYSKYEFLNSLENNNTSSFVVNLFTDCFYIVPINDDFSIQKKYCQKTNNWDTHKILKKLVSYPHSNKNKCLYSNDLAA